MNSRESPARAEGTTGSQRSSVLTRASLILLEDVGCGQVWGAGLERCGNCQTSLPKTRITRTTKSKNIPDRPSTGLTRTAPPVVHQGGRDQYTTGGPDKTVRSRDNECVECVEMMTGMQMDLAS